MVALLCTFSLPAHSFGAEPAPDKADKEYFEIVKSIDLLGEVYREVSKNYVDTINPTEFMYAGIDGMLRTLDPYTVFLDEEDAGELEEQTNGQYVGVGITIAAVDGVFFVTSVTEGHSAAQAGIKVGDHIVAINSKELAKPTHDEVRAQMKGKVGTSMTLQLERQGSPSFTVTLVREEVRVNTVSYSSIIDGVGYIEMKSFGTHSATELREAFQALAQQAGERHQPLKGMILDLRNNPGGLLNAAVDVSSLFINQGSEVVSIRGRTPEMAKSYRTENQPLDAQVPLVLLINSQSASAAEIVSGAIQDLDRGVILGERSFGKGLVQSVVRISYDTSVKLTIAKYYTPSGRLIQKEMKPSGSSRKVVPKANGENASPLFSTKAGRKVYGGGGITPDIELSETATSPYLAQLRHKGMLFLFSNDYCATNSSKPSFSRDHTFLMALFNDFLQNKKFLYTSEAERRFNEMKEGMKKSDSELSDSRRKSVELMQQEIEAMKAQEIERESSTVAKALEVEILRHYDDRLARKAELDTDPTVKRAVELLSDSTKYSAILHPATPVN